MAVVSWLHAEGSVTSYWACLGLAVVLSLAASLLGSAYWKRRRGPGDLLFSELLLWGWLRRLRAERRASQAVRLLGLAEAQGMVRVTRPGGADQARLLEQLSAALDAQDPYTDGHSRRVAMHAALIARRLGLSHEQTAKLRAASALHDIGKLRIPPEVLNKPGKLSLEEFELTKRHADDGAQIVSSLGDAEIVAMVRHHHERFDGAGYPSGLVGEEAPLGARIIAVADMFDALTSARPYRPATSHQEALALVEEVSGTQLDPVVVRAFLKCYSGRRTAVFWTLLAISPARALAFVGGRRPGLSVGSPAGVVASAAAVTAAAAAAIGPPAVTTLASHPVAAAQQAAIVPLNTAIVAGKTSQPARGRRVRKAPAPRQAPPAPPPHVASTTPVGTNVNRTPAPSPAHRAPPARKQGKPVGAPVHKGGGHHGGGGQPGGGTPPASSGGGAPPATPAGPPAGNSGGGTTSTPSAPPTPPAGGGPGGPPTPLTVADCKNGGWTNYPQFTNQGQCVSSVVSGQGG